MMFTGKIWRDGFGRDTCRRRLTDEFVAYARDVYSKRQALMAELEALPSVKQLAKESGVTLMALSLAVRGITYKPTRRRRTSDLQRAKWRERSARYRARKDFERLGDSL